MLYFENDYSEGAHEAVLRRLIETNYEKAPGYGTDEYTKSAVRKIREACKAPEADVRFIVGGTQTNQLVIAAVLGDCEGVIAADSGHINTHEAGAIEYTGHKVLSLPGHEGKLDSTEVKKYLDQFFNDANHEHMVFPGMVYISHPTEYGTLYTKEELTALSEVCRERDIPLYMDGARLGYALASGGDLGLSDIARLTDVFYIGGTKVGALCGEAVVFPKGGPKRFTTVTKRHGALLAKGRLLGVQFDALFTDGLYEKIARTAIETANEMKHVFEEKGYTFYLKSPTNQQFLILENAKMEELRKKVAFSFWEKYDDNHSVVRFATSWATTPEDVAALSKILS
ncbi:MAG: low specificity L-threonine aldolase [Oscillospiraceae bacterium]|nr:low specificity L-threonine aldolase [Oscillospiraceae bacterium]